MQRSAAATNPYSATGALNPLGLGIGARAGVVLLDHLYGGVDVMYYLGGSGPALGGPPGPPVTLTDHTWKYGVEAGAWATSGSASAATSPACATPARAACTSEPGVTALLSFGMLFVGADANVLVLPQLDESNAVFTADGQVGVKF